MEDSNLYEQFLAGITVVKLTCKNEISDFIDLCIELRLLSIKKVKKDELLNIIQDDNIIIEYNVFSGFSINAESTYINNLLNDSFSFKKNVHLLNEIKL